MKVRSPLRAIALTIPLLMVGCGSLAGPNATPTRTDAPRPDPSRSGVAGPTFDDVDTSQVRDLPPNHGPARAEGPDASGNLGWLPTSERIEEGVVYRFSLSHCGLQSPVDVDASFWDAVEGITGNGRPMDLATDPEMINATSGLFVVIGDEARFLTSSGAVVRFVRHAGAKVFPPCM